MPSQLRNSVQSCVLPSSWRYDVMSPLSPALGLLFHEGVPPVSKVEASVLGLAFLLLCNRWGDFCVSIGFSDLTAALILADPGVPSFPVCNVTSCSWMSSGVESGR